VVLLQDFFLLFLQFVEGGLLSGDHAGVDVLSLLQEH